MYVVRLAEVAALNGAESVSAAVLFTRSNGNRSAPASICASAVSEP
jgi:hypothetical protein